MKIKTIINDSKMQLEGGSWYKVMPSIPESWKVGDDILITQHSPHRDGAMGKSFNTVLKATNTKDKTSRSVTLSKADNAPEAPSGVKRFNTLDDVELGKKYTIEDVDSHSNITVGSRKFTLNPLSVIGKAESLDWQPGDTVVFSKGVSKNKLNLNVENLDREGKNQKLGFYFPADS